MLSIWQNHRRVLPPSPRETRLRSRRAVRPAAGKRSRPRRPPRASNRQRPAARRAKPRSEAPSPDRLPPAHRCPADRAQACSDRETRQNCKRASVEKLKRVRLSLCRASDACLGKLRARKADQYALKAGSISRYCWCSSSRKRMPAQSGQRRFRRRAIDCRSRSATAIELATYFIHGASRGGPVPLTLEEALQHKTIVVRETGQRRSNELLI